LEYKLKGTVTETITQSGYLAVMLSRVSAFVCPLHSLSSDLVANHMATLLACDNERRGCLAAYVAEPMLAMAAAGLWKREGFLPKHGIPALQRAHMSGSLSLGVRGETVAQIVLLLAFDKALALEGSRFGTVSLKSFLTQLLPEGVGDEVLDQVIPSSLPDPRVACLQFVHLAHPFHPQTLRDLAQRHCGATFIEGQRGADLLIPIISTVPASISIQVKNLSSCQGHCNYTAASCFELLPSRFLRNDVDQAYGEALDKSSVRLLLQLGARDASVHVNENGKRKASSPKAFEVFGLSPRCLAKAQADSLATLLKGRVDLESYIRRNAELSPNPDAGGSRIRNAWPFVVDRRDKAGER
jgi:hypothetical protein